ncbi:nucleoside recognition domain-containing protein [Photobacterium minamisatsumaniensis]|uniref:nucleoside recognition domain-containing protein n=1 Tax=Photobacterium minamisatsumaniensis TaxID=2910233 RepID=UPI003D14B71D
MPLTKHKTVISQLISDIFRVYFALLKVLIPATIIVKVLEMFGATQWLASLLSPVMSVVGLSESLGLVWAVALLTNIYTAMVVFYSIAGHEVITVADASVLGTMILIGHALPVEGAVAKATGVSWRVTIAVRVGGAIVLGAILNQVYLWGDWQQQPINLVWQPTASIDASLASWSIDQIQMLLTIFVILSGLITLLRILRWVGIEALMHKALYPLLRSLTLGKEAANITVIGATLGLSFGAGLLIDEVKQGHISKRDTLLVMSFLGLCHSVIEDTLLILLLGADIMAILWARLVFAIIVIAIWGRLMPVRDIHPTPEQ